MTRDKLIELRHDLKNMFEKDKSTQMDILYSVCIVLLNEEIERKRSELTDAEFICRNQI